MALGALFLAAGARDAGARPASPDAAPDAATTRAAAARTSTTAEAPAEVEEVEVTAKREVAPPLADPTATTSAVGPLRLARARARGDDLGAVADTVTGARVIDLGGPVADRRLTVRGGAPSQALVVVDGVRQLSPFATGLDLGVLSLESVESLQLVRGGAGALYGDGALTGALVLTTAGARAAPEESLLLSYGSYGTTRVAAREARSPVAVSGSFEHTDGGFGYVSRIRGLPDAPKTRENADATRGTLALRVDDELGDTHVRVAGGGSLREAGVPGYETQPQLDARERRATAQLSAELARPLEGKGKVPELTLALSSWLLDIDYTDARPEGTYRSATTFYVLGAEGSLALTPWSGHVARASASIGREQASSTEHGTPSRLRASAAISDEALFGTLVVFGALRAEGVGGQALQLLPRAGVRFEPSTAWSLTFGLGRSLRSPAIDELYHPSEQSVSSNSLGQSSSFSGNPALRAESAWEAELLLAVEPVEDVHLRAGAFARTVSDTIVYWLTTLYGIRPNNEGGSRTAGAELEAALAREVLGTRVSLDASSSLLFGELTSTGGPIPMMPRWSAGAELAASRGVFGVSTALRGFAATSANLKGTLEVPAYLRWDAALEVRPSAGTVVSLSVTNLLDDRTLQTMTKIPLPGRAAFVSLRVSTEPSEEVAR